MKQYSGASVDFVFVSNFWPPDNRGGFEVGCMRLAHEIISHGYSVTVVTASNVSGNQGLELLPVLQKYRSTDWIVFRLIISVMNCFRLYATLSMINPKSVVFFGLHDVGYLMLFKSYRADSARFVYCSDETYVHWDDISRRVLKHKSMIDRMLSKLFSVVGLRLENASRISAIHTSSYIERASSTVFSVFQSNSVLHWGVNLDGCERSERVEEAISIALGGRICNEKGTDVGLHAILLACKERPKQIREVRLLGNIPNDLYGAHILSLITAIREFGVIVTVTIVDSKDVQRQLRECDCFLLPSVWDEPFSIMLVEAMSVGNFCVVSDTGGSSEICKHKVNGYLCDKPTALEFYAGLMWYLDNRSAAKVIQLEAENTVKGALSMGEMANKFVKLTYSG